MEILKTGVDKALFDKEVKLCALAVGQLFQRAVLMCSTYRKPQWELGNWNAASLWI